MLAARSEPIGGATPRAGSPRAYRPGRPEVGPWWTTADQAEFDVLAYALVDGVLRHRDRCAACATCGSAVYCERVSVAIEAVLDWLSLRSLVSRAEWLRRRHLYARLAELEEVSGVAA
jgi:hypothetical protein